MFAARNVLRVPLRSPTLRRPIHSGVRGDWNRSLAGTIGFVAATTAGAIGTYVSYKSGGNTKETLGEKYPEVRRPPPTKSAQSSLGQILTFRTRIIEPSGDAPTPQKDGENVPEGGMDGLEADAANQGAFNPETGEINWDCPCLGGMAHGPCGPEFREAFSCFVYSKEDPKGVDCVEKFKAMQDCFREHPDVYGEELEDDDEAPDATKEPKTEGGDESPVAGDEKNTKSVAGEDAPAPPNPAPESRTRAPTANVAHGETPTKSSAKH
ncbi:mitochondrial intermembrane space import and assembly protein [Rhizoctonia solani]|uniref:Mitochondrial intermembrane space import and assembly protein 40 n=1 Tax=Rhizoctonia solani TaxID=456999 RepID=A0A8H8SXP5_9AGAM|nr:mitochondrial intermembrane space import and assembly protein [Rhizoctonia solani]QRW21729.1 mitochondrial intermembrane space import and assembly protein [Rhizoctonia solani]